MSDHCCINPPHYPVGHSCQHQHASYLKHLISETTVELVISLPRGAFPFTPAKMCAMLLRKERPPAGHEVLLAEVSERRAMGTQLDTIAEVYQERTQ